MPLAKTILFSALRAIRPFLMSSSTCSQLAMRWFALPQ